MLAIVENRTGEILSLKWKGLPGRLGVRILLSVLLLPFIVFLGSAFLNTSIQMVTQFQPAHIGIALITLFFLAFLLAFFFIVHYGLSGWTRFLVNSQKQQIYIKHGGLLPLSYEIPFSSVRKLRFEIGAEKKDELLKIKVLLEHENAKGGSKKREEDISVEACNLRAEAVELALQIGKLLGWSGYSVHRNDPRKLQIALQRSPDKKGALAIPLGVGQLNFAQDMAPRYVDQPEVKLPSFAPQKLRLGTSKPHQLAWNPGTEVRLKVPGASVGEIITGIIGMSATGLFFGFIFAGVINSMFQSSLNPLYVMIPGALLLVVAFVIGNRSKNPEKEFHFDWSRKVVDIRVGSRRRQVSFQEIQELILRGESRRVSGGKGRKSYTNYWCELDMILPGPDVTMLRTEEYSEEPDGPYKMALPMCVELAKSIGVPWRWQEY